MLIRVEIGQRVIAFGPGTFGSHLTTLADLVVPVPDALPDREAATFGIAYLTAWHALCEVGRLAPGERVLIHSATGGVGLAAVSIAKMIGARIYTTAGSAAKRELLSGLGVEYVGDSRSRGVRRRNTGRHRRLRCGRRSEFVVRRSDSTRRGDTGSRRAVRRTGQEGRLRRCPAGVGRAGQECVFRGGRP